MSDGPHFGVVPIDNRTLPSTQDKVNNIKGYGFSGGTAKLFDKHPHFSIFPGDSVEIMPVLPIPGA